MNDGQKYLNCDAGKLDALLQEALSTEEVEAVEAHLSECPACAERLQLAAVSAGTWSDARSMLAVDEFDGLQSLESVASIFGDGSDQVAMATDEVLRREICGWLDPTDDPEMLGRFAGYEITGIIGHGGMGVVMKGFEASLNRYVAIKVLAPRLATNGTARQRFAREAQAAAAILHENIVAIHRVDVHHGLPFLVMPYIAGISLQKRVDDDGPLQPAAVLRIGHQIAAGLAAAHEQGLVHRDIKPANILLDQGVERITITDFGLARAMGDSAMTRTGLVAGTPQYMSPEQSRGDDIDSRSDLFCLGSVLYFMCCGHSPFRAETTPGVLQRIMNDEPRPIQTTNPDIPSWLVRIIERLLAKDPGERFQSAEEVSDLCRQWLAHLQQPDKTAAPKEKPVTKRLAPSRFWSGRWRVWIAGGLLAVISFAVIVLELNKGTLTIDSDLPNVPIRVMRGDKVVAKLTVHHGKQSTRIAAGDYVVVVDGGFEECVVDGHNVTLTRGGAAVVRIHERPEGPPAIPGPDTRLGMGEHRVDDNVAVDDGDPRKSSAWEIHKVVHPAHKQGIWSVTFSPNGQVIASAAADKTVKLWDVASGRELNVIQRPVNCTKVAFSPDSRLLAIAGGDHGADPAGEVVLWDLEKRELRAVLESHEQAKYSTWVAFSPDGQWLASSGNDGTAKIWNVTSGKLHKTIDDHTGLVSRAVFSPKGDILATSSFDATIKLWKLPDGEPIGTLQGHEAGVRDIAFSPDASVLISASEDETARVWNVSTQKQIGVMEGHQDAVYSVAFSPDGQHVATGSRGNMGLLIWDVTNQQWREPNVFPRQSSGILSLAFSPNGNMLAISGGWNSFQIWKRPSTVTPQRKKNVDNVDNVLSVFSGDIRRFVFQLEHVDARNVAGELAMRLGDNVEILGAYADTEHNRIIVVAPLASEAAIRNKLAELEVTVAAESFIPGNESIEQQIVDLRREHERLLESIGEMKLHRVDEMDNEESVRILDERIKIFEDQIPPVTKKIKILEETQAAVNKLRQQVDGVGKTTRP